MILEGIATTRNKNDTINVAPMGPIVGRDMRSLVFRPFKSSTTYTNLKRARCGVFHVVDDVLLLAKAAVRLLDETPATFPAEHIDGHVLRQACRWYEFEVTVVDDSNERTRLEATVVHTGRIRDVFGFNRAKHAVLEAAILATRVRILEADALLSQLESLRSPVEKTAGPEEAEAFELLFEYIHEAVKVSHA